MRVEARKRDRGFPRRYEGRFLGPQGCMAEVQDGEVGYALV